ncbi:carboxypeptidase regulatory-like domain-containing protein, partial [Candidatus Bipolaricaulota bacterium]|nr:carboxypeptidase regulatory-like domain-containing protein [Candidatus Bipolaricaulota bacterium]
NVFCLSSIPSQIPNLVVTDVNPVVDCQAGTAQVTATVGNTGCGDATGVIFRLTSPTCGLSIDSSPISLAASTSQDIVFTYTPNCDGWNCTYVVTADPDTAICECDGANELTFTPYPGIGSIGDRVWFDFNGNGVQDAGEDGIPNVTVVIEGDLDGDGFIDYTAELTTDANGEYLFDELPAGDYTITVDDATLPDGLNQTYDYDGLGTPHTSDYTLAENEHNREQDFGYRGSGSIGDYVWFDINGDGVQDPSEEGIEAVTVTLQGDVDGDGIDEILTATTDADGLYLFDFLPAGDYTITVDNTTLPDGLTQTYDYDGLGTANISDYSLGSGEHNREQDFGYATPALSVDKIITDILRSGASIGNITGPVEPGDVIVYRFVIENVGPVPAYGVGFDDTLPPGIVTDTDAPGNAGTYIVTSPALNGTLALADEINTFTASIDATINAGETLTATFTAIVTSAVTQGVDLTNSAHAFGLREDGTPIPTENVLLGDISDSDVEDPDADDTGIVTVGVLVPALSVNKTITDITRGGSSTGISGPVEPGDIVSYRFVITNVGGGTAYDVEFSDTLPPGIETVAGGGTYSVSAPADSGSMGLSAGASSF